MEKIRKGRSRGFSLIEVLLALAVLALGILAIVGLLNATFASVSQNLQTSQALAVYNRLDRAFADITEFSDASGNRVYTKESMTKSNFEYVYDLIRGKLGQSWSDALFVVCYNQRINPDDDRAPQLVMNAILADSENSLPSKSELDSLDFEGNVYLVRISVSPNLAGQRVTANSDGEVVDTEYSVGGSLPSSVNNYALAHLPVTIEVYPFAIGVSSQSTTQLPIFTQMLVISR